MAFTYKAIKGIQFSRSYYQVSLPYRDVGFVTRVNPDVQRPLKKKRAGNIADYIMQDDGMFPSVTLGATGPIAYKNGEITFADSLFVIDGQHRVEGIKRALLLENADQFGDWHLPVVIFPNLNTERQAQFFTDLNGFAKAVTKAQRYAREYRDPAVLYTRDVLRELRIWDSVQVKSSSLAKGKKWAFTWLVEANRQLISALQRTDQKNQIAILTDFWGAVFRALYDYLGDKERYICSSSVITYLIANVGRNIITAEDRTAMVERLGQVNWAKDGGDFEGIFVQNGHWIRGSNQATDVREAARAVLINAMGAQEYCKDGVDNAPPPTTDDQDLQMAAGGEMLAD